MAILNMGELAGLHVVALGKGLAMFLGDVACAAQVLLRVFVVDEKLAVLAVAVGLVAGDGDHVEDTGGLVEDGVHLLQRSVGGLWIEEVDNREDEGVTKIY